MGDQLEPWDLDQLGGQALDLSQRISEMIFGAGWPRIPDGNPWRKDPNGRDQALDYRSPLEPEPDSDGEIELLEDVLDSEIVYLVSPPPTDPIDAELHADTCERCARSQGRYQVCAHCLNETITQNVAIPGKTVELLVPTVAQDGTIGRTTVTVGARLPLCRRCRLSAEDGALRLDEAGDRAGPS